MASPGRWIYDKRYEKRMKLMDLADKTKTSPSFISQVETGKRILPQAMFERLSSALGIPVADIVEHVRVDKMTHKFKSLFEDIDFNDQVQIRALARTLEDEGLRNSMEKIIKGEQVKLFE